MKTRQILTNSNLTWSDKLRPKVNSIYTKSGVDYQNTTGKNSDPALLIDWVIVTNPSNLKVFQYGEFQIFKSSANTANSLEVGDLVIGFVSNQFIRGTYLGGDTTEIASFSIIDTIEF